MSLEQEIIDSTTLALRCEGTFDSDYFKRFETQVLKSLNKGIRKFIINWRNIESVSSPALHFLQLLIELISNKNGKTLFCSVSPQVVSFLKAEGCEESFHIFPDESSAYDKIGSRLAEPQVINSKLK